MQTTTSIFLFSFISFTFAAQPSCPPGFQLINNSKCIRLDDDHIKHMEAEQQCRGYGGTIISFHNAIDTRAVMSMLSNAGSPYVWVGVFCFGNRTTDCYYDDGSGPLKYVNFAPGNPKVDNESIRDGGCVYAPTWGNDMGKWYSGPCEWTGIGFACEVPTTVSDKSCKHNYNGYCYFPSNELDIPDTTRSYLGAQDVCRAQFMELVSIHSRMEIDYIKSIYDGSEINMITLGAQEYVPGEFAWGDKTKFDYANMDPLSTVKGTCLQMDLSDRTDSGMWSQTNCQSVKHFTCKRQAGAQRILEEPEISPKFKAAEKTPPKQVLDLSDHCNSTILVAPGAITSLGYPNPQAAYCTWKLAALGPYNLGLYFTDFSVSDPVYVYGDNNTLLTTFEGDQKPFSFLAPINVVTLTHDSTNDKLNDKHGFSATILPY